MAQAVSSEVAALTRLRVATGIDAHPLGGEGPVILAGISIEHDQGLVGHSDADVVAHAAIDALLGAAGRDEDVGTCYPPDDPELAGADSMKLLAEVVHQVRHAGFELVNMDVTVVAELPRIAPHRTTMRRHLAAVLGVDAGRVTIRGTSTDRQGFVGRGEGIAAVVTCLMLAPESGS